MNCKKAKPLIPFFVEADLDAAEMEQVTTHLATCDLCREIVAEFQASQSLLHATALPEFDEAMLAEMRSAVLQNVAQEAKPLTVVEWLQPIWGWKLAFVAAGVLLLVTGVVISQRSVENRNHLMAGLAKDAPPMSPALTAANQESEKNSRSATPQPRTGRKNKAQGAVSVSERNPGNKTPTPSSPERATDVDAQIIAAAIAPSGANDSSANIPRVDTLGFTLPPAPQAEIATSSLEKSAPEPEMLRMEFQTADPNIRIIWLTPKTALASK